MNVAVKQYEAFIHIGNLLNHRLDLILQSIKPCKLLVDFGFLFPYLLKCPHEGSIVVTGAFDLLTPRGRSDTTRKFSKLLKGGKVIGVATLLILATASVSQAVFPTSAPPFAASPNDVASSEFIVSLEEKTFYNKATGRRDPVSARRESGALRRRQHFSRRNPFWRPGLHCRLR